MDVNMPRLVPDRTALLVMDYQPAILSLLPRPETLISKLAAVMETARSHGLHIGYVRVAFTDADYEAIPETNKSFAAVAGSRRLPEAAADSQIHDGLAPRPRDIIVRKTRVGSFSTTDLDEQLRRAHIDTLILAGISTSGVVLSTLRDAADKDYRLLVLEDCCADPDSEVHQILVHKVFPRQAYVMSAEELHQIMAAV